METALNPGMCRCCASEGAFKDIKSTYHWMGEEEVYADMLRECFDVILNASGQGEDSGICEVCITQLRNAINFKKQVLHTEEQFQKHLQNKTLFRPNIVKVEMQGEEESDDNMASGDEGFSGAEYEVPIKTELEDPKPKKRAAKAAATTTRASAKKAKADNGETSTKRQPRALYIEQIGGSDEAKKGEETPLKSASIRVADPQAATATCKTPPMSIKGSSNEIYKLKSNTIEIMRWSNATPIRNYGDMGYLSCHCEEQFHEPADLKKHTLQAHEDVTKAYFIKILTMYNYIIKLDITELQCKICHKNIDTTEELMEHLKNEHNKPIFTNVKNHILPFKFTTKSLECFICKKIFSNFRLLLMHMHVHYRNYICDTCDAGFVHYSGFRNHKARHKTNFICNICGMTFGTSGDKYRHMKFEHGKKYNFTCAYCNETFKDYMTKQAHLKTVHGLNKQKSICKACDKEFKHQKHLAVHIKRDHLMERPHVCKVCEKAFFTPRQLRDHMTSHTGAKPYKCEICLKSYGLLATLKIYMRIHNNDRRYKCNHCGLSFVHSGGWRSHIKAKHGEIV